MASTGEAAMKSCIRCGLQHSKLRRCSKCKRVWYCGPDCQKKDWVAGHKTNCGKTAELEEKEPNQDKIEENCDEIQVSYGVLTAKDVISCSPRSGFVKFPAANLGQFILKSAAEAGARIETKGTEVFVDIVSQCDHPDGQDWILLQIENLQRMGRLIEMLDAAYDYEAVVRFHFDVLLQNEEEFSSSSSTSSSSATPSDLLQWDSRLSTLASKCLRIYVYLSSLPHAVRDFASSLKFVEKGISFADSLQANFPDTRRNVYPVLTQLKELKETTLRCMGSSKNPSSDSGAIKSISGQASSPTKGNASTDDDDDFRRLVGVGDSLTLEERVDRAVDSGDDVEALKTLRQATQYFISLGDAQSVVEYASRFRSHAQRCYDKLEASEVDSSSSSSLSSDSKLKIITGFYVKAIETFVDQALPRIPGQSGQDAADTTQHAAFLAHAADLRNDDALEAATRCANWLEIGRVRRPHHVAHADFNVDVIVDRASARDYRLRVREILRGRGRDIGGERGESGESAKTMDCAICLDEIEIERCGGEEIRILPKCFHMFHEECVIRFEDVEARIINCPICKQVNKAL